jgi:hypothetical protein
MIRQLGKPTAFMTLSANEIKWPHLLKILYSLNDLYKDIKGENPLTDLTCLMRSTLVNEDPVTCCIYFKKLFDAITALVKAKYSYNPFGRCRVIRLLRAHRVSA